MAGDTLIPKWNTTLKQIHATLLEIGISGESRPKYRHLLKDTTSELPIIITITNFRKYHR